MRHRCKFVPVQIRKVYKSIEGTVPGEVPNTQQVDDDYVVSACECGKAKYERIQWVRK